MVTEREKSTVVVTGARGVLGGYVSRALAQSGYLVIPSSVSECPGFAKLDFLSQDSDALASWLEAHQVDSVVHLAAMSNVDECEKKPELSQTYNVDATRKLVEATNKAGALMVLASTNAVYDGFDAPYAENAERKPVHVYGRTKRDAEDIVMSKATRHLIFRFILSFGWHRPDSRVNPLTQLLNAAASANPKVKMVDDIFANTLYGFDAAQAVVRALDRDVENEVFNVAGATRQSRYEFALSVKKQFDLERLEIERVQSSAFPSLVPRPADTSFNCAKLEKVLGIRAHSVDDALAHCRKDEGFKRFLSAEA